MNNQPRQKLSELILQYGRSLCDDPRRCEALLRDFCGKYRGEISALINAQKEEVASELLKSSNSVPREILLARLTKRLQDNLYMTQEAALWAVEAWAEVLGVGSDGKRSRKLPIPSTGLTLKEYEFETVTVNRRGEVIQRTPGQAQYFSEYLGQGVTLDLIAIHGGTFMMGSPAGEGPLKLKGKLPYDDEKPQHLVTVQPFFMGKYPVTQSQWRVIASRNELKVNRDLNADPSNFNGDNRPVEKVNWYDAVEFCKRLSKATGREYRLPSEAEWEYACRAGTTTPFHFGKTISTDLANYDGYYTYADELEGVDRDRTIPIGQFPPNAFGLYDMHGNVWEWCEDDYHHSYNSAPQDGTAWRSKDAKDKMLRGGSCSDCPSACRSANRNNGARDNIHINIGFRVVCVWLSTFLCQN